MSCATLGLTNLRSASQRAFFLLFCPAHDHESGEELLLPDEWFPKEEIGEKGTKSSKSAKFWGTSTYIRSIISLHSLMTASTKCLQEFQIRRDREQEPETK